FLPMALPGGPLGGQLLLASDDLVCQVAAMGSASAHFFTCSSADRGLGAIPHGARRGTAQAVARENRIRRERGGSARSGADRRIASHQPPISSKIIVPCMVSESAGAGIRTTNRCEGDSTIRHSGVGC